MFLIASQAIGKRGIFFFIKKKEIQIAHTHKYERKNQLRYMYVIYMKCRDIGQRFFVCFYLFHIDRYIHDADE